MDFQKILNIILIIIVIYFICRDFLKEPMTENFENINIGSADDLNAINKLAQIASQLMAGGITVPGNMTVNGVLSPAHSVWHTSTDGKPRLNYGNNSHTFYRTADAHVWRNKDDQDRMVLDNNGVLSTAHSVWHTSTDGTLRLHYGNKSHTYFRTGDAHVWRNRDDQDRMVLDHGANLRVDGSLTVAGRNILAELDQCVKFNTQFRMSIPDDRGGVAGGGKLIGACGWACGGNASITGTNDSNRQLGLMINRW